MKWEKMFLCISILPATITLCLAGTGLFLQLENAGCINLPGDSLRKHHAAPAGRHIFIGRFYWTQQKMLIYNQEK